MKTISNLIDQPRGVNFNSMYTTVYVDGVNGDDTRTGATNDTNAVTGRIKTLTRVAALHSEKAVNLRIAIVGNLDIGANVDLHAPFVFITINSGVIVTFKKAADLKDASNNIVGDGTYKISFYGYELNIGSSGTINVEAHSGSTGLGDQWYYRSGQGAISCASRSMGDASRLVTLNILGTGTINVGDNTLFATGGGGGTNSDYFNILARYRRSGILGGTVNLGTNAVESYFRGERVTPRIYTPTNSTDANVSEGEVTMNSSYLYAKVGGVIRKIAWTTF